MLGTVPRRKTTLLAIRNEKIQAGLLLIAGLFILLYSASLTISPAVLGRSNGGPFRWDHWIGAALWGCTFALVHSQSTRRLENSDPYLLPIAALLSGWGMLTIWSMLPEFGLRQAIWIGICGIVMIAGFRLPSDLSFLRRYKYIWLTGSILLTGLTLFWGVNPLGYGPRMWLGCCGQYFQPSEVLKLLLLVFLAGYIGERQTLLSLLDRLEDHSPRPGSERISSAPRKVPLIPLIAPSLVMLGMAISILAVQRDLGTAFIYLFVFTVIIYSVFPKMTILAAAVFGLVLAGFGGYRMYDVIRIRVDAWINPWLDPSGNSYQIVQGLLATANGGLVGRGAGLGSPGFVPLSHSDLIFTAVAEQTGLIGVIGLLSLFLLLAGRGLTIVLHATNAYHRCLAAGLTAYLAGQSLLIIGGSLRMLPLTGITLPFVSYGGSSLFVSMLAIMLLMIISQSPQLRHPPLYNSKFTLHFFALIGSGFFLCALAAGWWSVIRSPELLIRTDNPRRTVSDSFVRRGSILDRNGKAINETRGQPGGLERTIDYAPLSNIIGFTHPTYGQSGLETSLDEYLRGTRGNPLSLVVWNQLIYGQPPEGLDIRLTIDLELQDAADRLLQGKIGSIVVINSENGEILAMSSSPTFNANRLDDEWDLLINDPNAPLFNRASLGRYPVGDMNQIFPEGLSGLRISPTPAFYLPSGDSPEDPEPVNSGYFSPLQMALAAAAVNGDGIRPAPRLVNAINFPETGWTPTPIQASPIRVLHKRDADQIIDEYKLSDPAIWQIIEVVERENGSMLTWVLGGRLGGTNGTDLALSLIIEEEASSLAEEISQALLSPP